VGSTYRRFVALGDSFTEGLNDWRADGSPRGWADRVAHVLSAQQPGFRYANLALRSLRMDQIVDHQVPAAVALRPDLVSIAGGGNDILGLRTDVGRVAARLEEAVSTLTATGATTIVFTGFDPRPHLPPGRFLASRTASLNDRITAIADRFGAHLVDLWSMPELRDVRLWSGDRLHLSEAGHRHVAATVLGALGVPAPDGWKHVDGPPTPASWLRHRWGTVDWARRHFAPWAVRKVRKRPAGLGLAPKHAGPWPWPEDLVLSPPEDVTEDPGRRTRGGSGHEPGADRDGGTGAARAPGPAHR
jgi:lysophospholipase L1-like esterase